MSILKKDISIFDIQKLNAMLENIEKHSTHNTFMLVSQKTYDVITQDIRSLFFDIRVHPIADDKTVYLFTGVYENDPVILKFIE